MVALPGGVAYGLMFHFLPNLPWQDDYRAILQFAATYRGLSAPGERLRFLIAAQHVDYKLIFEHVAVIAELSVLHRINFSLLMVLGDLFVLGILCLLWRLSFRGEADDRRRLILFVPVSVMLFSLNYAETLDWAMAGLQNLPVIFFSLGALYLLGMELGGEARDSKSRVAGACAAALLACCSSANGFLLGPIGLAVLLRRRRFWSAAIWSATFVPAIASYLYRFHPMVPAMHVAAYVKPLFFLAVLGGAAPGPLMLPLGVCVLGVAGWSLRAGFFRDNLPAGLMVVWIVLTAALIALGRGNFGLGAAHASRYKIYSDLMLIFCYVFVAERLRESPVSMVRGRRIYQAALLVSVLYCIRADVSAWRLLSQRDGDLRIGMAHYRANPAVNSPMYISDPTVQREQAASEDEAVRAILAEAADDGIYVPPVEMKR